MSAHAASGSGNLSAMTFAAAKMPGGDVAAWGAECRAKALAGVEAGNWRPVYAWTKGWIGWGGGAWIPDTWLLYAVSALLRVSRKLLFAVWISGWVLGWLARRTNRR